MNATLKRLITILLPVALLMLSVPSYAKQPQQYRVGMGAVICMQENGLPMMYKYRQEQNAMMMQAWFERGGCFISANFIGPHLVTITRIKGWIAEINLPFQRNHKIWVAVSNLIPVR